VAAGALDHPGRVRARRAPARVRPAGRLVEGRDLGWPWWAGAFLVAAVPAGAAFLAWERRVVAAGRSPLIELRLFAERGFRIGVAAAVALFVVPSFFLFLGLYLQDGGGVTPIESGVAFAPLAAALVWRVGAHATARAARGPVALGSRTAA